MLAAPIGTISVHTRKIYKNSRVSSRQRKAATAGQIGQTDDVIRCVELLSENRGILPQGQKRRREPSEVLKERRQRFIKVGYRGKFREQWIAYSRFLWTRDVGKIPDGYQVFHKDGDCMNDEMSNLALAREKRFHLILSNPETRRRQRQAQRAGVRRSNKRRHEEMREARTAIFKNVGWYVVLHDSSHVLARVFDAQADAVKASRDPQLSVSLARDGFTEPVHVEIMPAIDWLVLSGVDEPLESYRRYVMDDRPLPNTRKRDNAMTEELISKLVPDFEMALSGTHTDL